MKNYKHNLKSLAGVSRRTRARQIAVVNGGIKNEIWNRKDRINLYVKFPERWKARYETTTR